MSIIKENQSGFGAVGVILLVGVVAALVAVGLLVSRQDKQASKSTTSNSAIATSEPKHLVVKEWGVKILLPQYLEDVTYEVKGDTQNSVWLSSNSYAKTGCKLDGPSIGRIERFRKDETITVEHSATKRLRDLHDTVKDIGDYSYGYTLHAAGCDKYDEAFGAAVGGITLAK